MNDMGKATGVIGYVISCKFVSQWNQDNSKLYAGKADVYERSWENIVVEYEE